MDNNTETNEDRKDRSLAEDVARGFAINLAASAGLVAGLMIVGSVSNALKDHKFRKNAQKSTETQD
jgi:hypothetical protein